MGGNPIQKGGDTVDKQTCIRIGNATLARAKVKTDTAVSAVEANRNPDTLRGLSDAISFQHGVLVMYNDMLKSICSE